MAAKPGIGTSFSNATLDGYPGLVTEFSATQRDLANIHGVLGLVLTPWGKVVPVSCSSDHAWSPQLQSSCEKVITSLSLRRWAISTGSSRAKKKGDPKAALVMLRQFHRCPLPPALEAWPEDIPPWLAEGVAIVPRDSPLPEAEPVGPAVDPAEGDVQGEVLAAVAANCGTGCTRANPLLTTW